MNTLDKNKFATSSDLSETKQRQAALQGIENKYWIKIDGTDFLYKIDRVYMFGFAELFYSYVCNKLGMECVNAYPAHDKNEDTKGVIIESYILDKKANVPLKEFLQDKMQRRYLAGETFYSYDEFIKNLSKVQQEQGFVLEKGFLSKIKKMILLDFLLGNEDRHFYNIEVYVEKNLFGRTRVSLAPLFDNGMSLALRQLAKGDLDYEEFKYIMPTFGFYTDDPKMKFASPAEKFAYGCAKQLESDPELKAFYEQIKSLNLRAELEYVSRVSGYELADYKIEYITRFLEYRIDVLDHIMEKDYSQPSQDEQDYFNLDEDEYYDFFGVSRD